jgi:hypothetical protein
MTTRDRKGARVTGFFFILLGGGMVLESRAVWYGLLVMAIGAACFLWSFAGSEPRP